MQWIREWLDEHTVPRNNPKDVELPFARPKTDSDSEEERIGLEQSRDDNVLSDLTDGARTTLEFGKIEEEGDWGLLGYCELQKKKGCVKACEWRVTKMRDFQRYPACRIRF